MADESLLHKSGNVKFPTPGAGEPADSMNQEWMDEQDRIGYPGSAYGYAGNHPDHRTEGSEPQADPEYCVPSPLQNYPDKQK